VITGTVGILTVSDRAARGEYEDKSGPLIEQILKERTFLHLARKATVSDDVEAISSSLVAWSDEGLSLILTTGGTGFAPRDVTPEATRAVVDREAPGIPEAMRQESLKITGHAMLSRAAAGMRGRTLIVNLPGSPKAVKENLDVFLPVLPHALELLAGSAGSEAGHRSV
jgi:molybdenum cofactor synthesis domain-containing protein